MSAYQPLVIRQAQMRVLGLATLEIYLERLADHVIEVFPDHGPFIRSRAGRQFLRRCLDRARQYRLMDEYSIALFTDLVVALGEDFDEQDAHSWIRRHLDDEGLGATGKLFLIFKDLPDRCPCGPRPPTAVDIDDTLVPDVKVPFSRRPLWWGEAAP